ncbi:hypothetical protein [Halovivax asiaticus]|nr:hypothetical protein [Halovivax asiaticus]
MTDERSASTETSRRQVLRNLSASVAGAGALAAVGGSRGAEAETEAETEDIPDQCEWEYRCHGRYLQKRMCCDFGDYQCDPWETTNIPC